MKKSMLLTGLLIILNNLVYAENNSEPSLPSTTNASISPSTTNTTSQDVPTPTPSGIPTPTPNGTQMPIPQGSPTPTPDKTTPTPTPSTPLPDDKPIPASGTTAPSSNEAQPSATKGTQAPAVQGEAASAPAAASATPTQPIDCNYRIPAETTHIEQTLVMQWAEKATEQSFSFDHSLIDDQLAKLKACYTDQGWQGFNDALQKSGNLNAIKTQQLTVSGMMNGDPKISEAKENQWKISLPLQVVYQNKQEKIKQQLAINLLVGRKITGNLGIMQMIATPQQANMPNVDDTAQPKQ